MNKNIQLIEKIDKLKPPMTLADALDAITEVLEAAHVYFGHGTDNAWDEAVQLVLTVMNLPLDADDSVLGNPLNQSEFEETIRLLKLRVETRMPLPYLLQRAWFMGLPFYVDERVLIPRSLLGEWIAEGFSPWVDPTNVGRILEIGTGSACIAIACATVFPEAVIDAVDICPEAMAVATRNIEDYRMTNQIDLIQSDCYRALDGRQYDLIVSNPPYVGQDEFDGLPAEYRHEPDKALLAEDNGLEIVDRILRGAATHLSDDGVLIVEVGNTWAKMEERYPRLPFVWLEQSSGEQGVFTLRKSDLLKMERVTGD